MISLKNLSIKDKIYLESFISSNNRFLLKITNDPKFDYWTDYISYELGIAMCNICNHIAQEDAIYWQYHGYLHLKKYLAFL